MDDQCAAAVADERRADDVAGGVCDRAADLASRGRVPQPSRPVDRGRDQHPAIGADIGADERAADGQWTTAGLPRTGVERPQPSLAVAVDERTAVAREAPERPRRNPNGPDQLKPGHGKELEATVEVLLL